MTGSGDLIALLDEGCACVRSGDLFDTKECPRHGYGPRYRLSAPIAYRNAEEYKEALG